MVDDGTKSQPKCSRILSYSSGSSNPEIEQSVARKYKENVRPVTRCHSRSALIRGGGGTKSAVTPPRRETNGRASGFLNWWKIVKRGRAFFLWQLNGFLSSSLEFACNELACMQLLICILVRVGLHWEYRSVRALGWVLVEYKMVG